MSNRTNILLHLLAAAGELGYEALNRTAITKMVYLSEMLRPSYELWQRSYEYDRYNYGPYSDDVFRKLDFLIFHGLVQVHSYTKQFGRIKATYEITEYGIGLSNELAEKAEGKLLKSLSEDLVWGLQTLGIKTAKGFCRIVYKEPGFETAAKNAERQGFQKKDRYPLPDVHAYQHPSFRLQAIIESFHQDRINNSPRELVRTYLNYLATRSYRSEAKRSLPSDG